ncbi:APC family permease [Nocardia abscessus]|uniref:APC family permease n=1 Tax=Nocardia abscessus TaxID=120957 RepID=UPI0012FB8319|nr:APC family permease [Nocardia abscessus]MCC3331560.1 APC family permease [Nocardia abscessus]
MINKSHSAIAGTSVPHTRRDEPGAVSDDLRDFSLSSVFGIAFAFISPIIALYAIFDIALGIAGPSFWWAFVVILGGQLLVALVFGELSSRWPEEGGVYAWSKRLVGESYGWLTGWVYIWTLITLNAAAAFAASTFAAAVFGLDNPGTGMRLAFAVGFMIIATLVNSLDRRLLRVFIALSIACEVIGSLFVGTVLLAFHRHNSLSVLWSGFDDGGMAFTVGPFLAAVAVVGWAFIGFESAGDLAAEVKNPGRNVPLAQIASLVLVAATVMYAGLALILAVPDLEAVAAGSIDDSVVETLLSNLGSAVVVPMSVVVSIGFAAGIAAVSTALSRSVHAMAVQRSLPGSAALTRLSGRDRLPRNALTSTSVATCSLLILAVGFDFYDVMIAMSTGGFYIAFFLPVAAMLFTRVRGMWTPGVFRLGKLGGLIVNAVATLWLLLQIINISWPRDVGATWYVEWGCLLMYLLTGVLGATVFLRYRRTSQRIGTDA